MKKPNRYLPILIVVCVSMLLGILVNVWLQEDNRTPGPYAHLGGDFTLQSANGPVALKDLRGKVVPIYFGFTHCPDICPTTLQRLGQAIESLPEATQQEVQGLFITVDPERDDAAKLASYTRHFSDRILGLTGSLDAITKVAKSFLVIFAKVALEDSAMGYTIDHSSRIYIIGRDGKIDAMVHHGDEADAIAAQIKQTAGK